MWPTGTTLCADAAAMEVGTCVNGIIFHYSCDEGPGLDPRNPICLICHYYIKGTPWSAEPTCHLQLGSGLQEVQLSDLKKATGTLSTMCIWEPLTCSMCPSFHVLLDFRRDLPVFTPQTDVVGIFLAKVSQRRGPCGGWGGCRTG